MADRHRVLVTGVATLAGDVCDMAGLTALLRAGRSVVAQGVSGYDWDTWLDAVRYRDPDTANRLRRLARAAATPELRMTLSVATQAVAGLRADPHEIGIVVAGSNLQLGRAWQAFGKMADEPAYLSPRHGYEFYDTHVMALLAEALDLRGHGMTVGGASASGNVALTAALDLVRHGRVAACLVVGPVPDLSPAEWTALRSMGALSPTATCRPFDRTASGFVPTPLCAAVLLESEPSARTRGVAMEAVELAGACCVMGASHLPSPDAEAEWRAMAGALADGAGNAADLDLISAHATGTPAGDAAEVAAIRRLLGDGAGQVPVNAPKSLLGHGLHAAGIVELIAMIAQMQGSFVHGNAGLETPIATDLCLPRDRLDRPVRLALGNGFGFGGINSAILVRAGEG
ncbi:MAG: beta-ketoacyl synthase N-terminal-like domain-containing protein [Acetobacteraceae bacterium]